MANVTLKGGEVQLRGSFLETNDLAPNFALVNQKLETLTLESFKGKKKIIATVVSLDTAVCKIETKKINELALTYPEAVVLIISKDLPFRQKEICKTEHLDNILILSDIRPDSTFGKNYGVLIEDGPLAGLIARSIVLLNESDKVIYSELVSEITEEPQLNELSKHM